MGDDDDARDDTEETYSFAVEIKLNDTGDVVDEKGNIIVQSGKTLLCQQEPPTNANDTTDNQQVDLRYDATSGRIVDKTGSPFNWRYDITLDSALSSENPVVIHCCCFDISMTISGRCCFSPLHCCTESSICLTSLLFCMPCWCYLAGPQEQRCCRNRKEKGEENEEEA